MKKKDFKNKIDEDPHLQICGLCSTKLENKDINKKKIKCYIFLKGCILYCFLERAKVRDLNVQLLFIVFLVFQINYSDSASVITMKLFYT